MKAIIVRYLPATNFKGARIKATAEGVKPLTLSRHGINDHKDGEELFRAGAQALCDRMGWTGELVGGGLPDQTGYAFCFKEG